MENEIMVTNRTMQEITADIRMNQRMAAVSIAAIGADLIDAKAKLSHGEWMPWLDSIDMAQSTADNYMRFARETRGQEWLAAMSYSKAMAILALPEETRKSFAEEHDVDSKSAAEIKRLVAEAKKAKAAAEAEKEKAAQALAEEIAKREAVEAQTETLRQMMRERPEKIIKETVAPPDYEAIKGQVATLRDRLQEAEAAAIDADERAAKSADDVYRLQMELADRKESDHLGSSRGLSLDDMIKACDEFSAKVWAVPFMEDYFREAEPYVRQQYIVAVDHIASWARQVSDTIKRASGPIVLPQEVTCND